MLFRSGLKGFLETCIFQFFCQSLSDLLPFSLLCFQLYTGAGNTESTLISDFSLSLSMFGFYFLSFPVFPYSLSPILHLSVELSSLSLCMTNSKQGEPCFYVIGRTENTRLVTLPVSHSLFSLVSPPHPFILFIFDLVSRDSPFSPLSPGGICSRYHNLNMKLHQTIQFVTYWEYSCPVLFGSFLIMGCSHAVL